jgi:hypothetical protein
MLCSQNIFKEKVCYFSAAFDLNVQRYQGATAFGISVTRFEKHSGVHRYLATLAFASIWKRKIVHLYIDYVSLLQQLGVGNLLISDLVIW